MVHTASLIEDLNDLGFDGHLVRTSRSKPNAVVKWHLVI